MFETAEVGSSLGKARFKKIAESLRIDLLKAQHDLASSGFSLVVLVGGVEGAGKTEFANLLLSWADAHFVETHALAEPSDEERERPPAWRFWRTLPARGRTALYLTSWYTRPIVERVFKRSGSAEFDQSLDRLIDFERMLTQENALVVKLWFHISKAEQARRFRKLEKDPDQRWRVTPVDWRFHKKYRRFEKICEHALMKTSTAEAPWQIVEATDRRWRNATAARLILEAVKKRLEDKSSAELAKQRKPDRPRPKPGNIIRKLDLSLKLSDKTFDRELEKLQGRLGLLAQRLRRDRRSLILAFEGSDAAGKGGAIRRITEAMDARLYRVDSVAAPTDEEKAHPYLWRFWRVLPRLGRVTLYDRSWYGRVLVERVEGFAAPSEWRRAYAEINAFEEQLSDSGTIVLKFWLAISADEQLRRFKDRQKTAYKQYKITAEDWRNREKWDAYQAAACEMIERTSTDHAPWVLVEAEDKKWARVKVLKAVVDRLSRELD
ncbi:MAG: polyphosphate:AMP phosphotransferase [Elusimicrobia bacterium]|nr:polyphosphate:AMP phosphotransferase [Elusimicrobiota bacterium]